MIEYEHKFRVKYSDTDQMGIMHHSAYVKHYENARWELFRNLGIPYSSIENSGTIIPVKSIEIDYIKPAAYDQELTINLMIRKMPKVKLEIEHEMFNLEGQCINRAKIVLAFLEKSSMKIKRCPNELFVVLSANVLKGQ